MPRTPLLRSIKRLVSQCRTSGEKGCVDGAGLSRREFVLGGATLAAAASMPGSAWAGKSRPSVAIIGGGMAGLNCALTLADHGVAATIYEASPRVGGRMFSNQHYWDDAQVSEWCGELIDTGHKTVRQLAKRFGLALDDLLAAQPKGAEDTYYFGGQFYPQHQAELDFQALAAAVDADLAAAGYPTRFDSYTEAGYALDQMSVYEWIESRVAGGHASRLGQLLDVAYNIEYGAETRDQSALNLLYLLAYQPSPNNFAIFGESDERFHIRGGNESLPKAMAASLGAERVRLNHRLIKLSKNSVGGYDMVFNAGSGVLNVSVDIVVLAVPFSVLREIDYTDAGFDARKRLAIQELGRGRNGKLQLQFDHRLWNRQGAWPGVSNGSSYSDTGYQGSWDVSRGQPGSSGIMVFYSGGDTTGAMSTERPFATASLPAAEQDARRCLRQAESVFPGLTHAWNGKITQSLPHLSPYFKASYAYYRVGQYTAFGGYEGEAQGRVAFCGDHTSQDYQGYMEGAASEGERAGRQVLKWVRA